MKKWTILFSLFVVFALVFTACSPAEEDDAGLPDTGQESPFGDETPVVTQEDLGLDATPTVMEEDLELTATPAMEATATPAVEETAEATPAGGEGLPATGEMLNAPSYASNMMDWEIQTVDDEEVAGVDDFVFSLDNSQLEWLVADVGGFLGIGGKSVAIPYSVVTVVSEDDADLVVEDTTEDAESTAAVEGTPDAATEEVDEGVVIDEDGQFGIDDGAFVLNVDQDVLENAPEFNWDEIDLTVPEWDQALRSYWEPFVTETGAQMGAPSQAIRMSHFLDADVLDDATVTTEDAEAQGDDIGDVDNLIVVPDTGEIQYALIQAGDALELDDKVWIPVTLENLNIVQMDENEDGVFDADELTISIAADTLRTAPTVPADGLTWNLEQDVETWDDEWEAFWAEQDVQ